MDVVDLARDQAANRLEAIEATATSASEGGVLHYGIIEAVAQEFTFTSDSNCRGSSCSNVSTVDSELVPVTFRTSLREQNDGQVYRSEVGSGDRVVQVAGSDPGGEPAPALVEFDLSRLPPSTLHLRDPGSGAYYRRHQENTPADQLVISLTLQDRYRRDALFDPDAGSVYGERGLPAMGFEPWTYDSLYLFIDPTHRLPELNEWHRDPIRGLLPVDSVHVGYRQPRLDRVYPEGNDLVLYDDYDSDELTHIRWPVNFEDLNWYLYELPTRAYRDPLWLYWVSDIGRQRVVTSAYGYDPVPFPLDGDVDSLEQAQLDRIPHCFLPGAGPDDPDFTAPNYRPPLNIDAIRCDRGVDSVNWDWARLWAGDQQEVNLPFDAPGEAPEHVLNRELLVKQGVERASDAAGPIGSRRLNRFDFVIDESRRMGVLSEGNGGRDAERRYGLPRDEDRRREYVNDWAFEPMDPNMPHLLVVTFYEARFEGQVDFTAGGYVADQFPNLGPDEEAPDLGLVSFSLPKRQMHRVVCRLFVHPSGNDPGEDDDGGGGFWVIWLAR